MNFYTFLVVTFLSLNLGAQTTSNFKLVENEGQYNAKAEIGHEMKKVLKAVVEHDFSEANISDLLLMVKIPEEIEGKKVLEAFSLGQTKLQNNKCKVTLEAESVMNPDSREVAISVQVIAKDKILKKYRKDLRGCVYQLLNSNSLDRALIFDFKLVVDEKLNENNDQSFSRRNLNKTSSINN